MMHKRLIHYKNAYKCDQCPLSSTLRKVKSHIQTAHRGLGKALVETEEKSWRDACKFTCRVCPKETSKRNDILAHSKKEHGTDGGVKHYFMSKKVNHVCILCKKHVPQETRKLHDHMNKRHALTLATYEEKHYFPSQNLKRLSWRDACIFACNSCSKEASNRYDMMLHCREEHGVNGTQFHYSMLNKVNHMCLLCKKLVLHETDILNNHMVEMHSINLATYEKEHYFPSLKGESQERHISHNI